MGHLEQLGYTVIKTGHGTHFNQIVNMYIEKIGKNGIIYKYKDLCGEVFGTLTALYRGNDVITKNRTSMSWVCKCECGSIKQYNISNLLAGRKKLKNGEIKIFSCGCKSSLPFGVSACKAVFRQYKVHAANRGYEFAIGWDDFVSLTNKNCHYCNAAPKNKIGKTERKRGNGHYIYNGIDRMNNNKGYTLDNVVPCCRRCNRAKDVMGRDDFLGWIREVFNHSILLKN